MLTILPIQTKKHEELKPTSHSRPVFNPKADTFECASKPIVFKGNKRLTIAEFFLKPVLEETDIAKKTKLIGRFNNYCHDVLRVHYADASGVYCNAKTEGTDNNLGELLFDRSHEMGNCTGTMNLRLDGLRDKRETSPDKYNEIFVQTFNRVIGIVRRYNLFIKHGLQNNTMKPAEVFKLAVDYAAEGAKDKGVRMVVEGEDVLSKYQEGIVSTTERLADYKLYTILSNLMQNAVKYTRDGSTVNVRFAEQMIDGKKYLVFSVRDEGIGIPKEAQEKVFIGKRAQNAIDSGIHGTGYGLGRTKKIIKLFQGSDIEPIQINSPLLPEDTQYPGTEITAYLRLKD